MTVFNAIILDFEFAERINNFFLFAPEDTSFPQENLDALIENPVLTKKIDVPVKSNTAKKRKTIVLDGQDDLFFNDVWFFVEDKPIISTEIDLGFITEQEEIDIKIWNANIENSVVVSSIQKINELGIDLDHDPVPNTIVQNNEDDEKITVFIDGPAIQNTIYIYTIGSDVFTVIITGKRILAFNFKPDWNTRLKTNWVFETVINKNTRFTEQRRPLYERAVFQLSADFVYCDLLAQRFKESLRLLSNKVLAIANFAEPILIQEDIQGLTTISTNDFSNKSYLNLYADFVVIFERNLESTLSEIKEINSLGVGQITFNNPVLEDFKQGKTIIYPAFLGVMKVKETHLNAQIVRANIDFEEIFV